MITQGVHLQKYVHLPSFVYWYSRHLCSINGGWGPLAKVGLSAKFGVVVFKASILNSKGGPLGKMGSSLNFGVAVIHGSILDSMGGPSAKICSSAKFCVLVFKASMLY